MRQGASRILFVEGNRDGLDVTVLRELLAPVLRVEPLGACFSIRSAAQALHEYHPNYWFVIDRDDWDDAKVEASWKSFPDAATMNLLIWRRKELESYFLEPVWFCTSRYCRPKTDRDALEGWLAKEAQKILWLEAANRVLISLRNTIKQGKAPLLKHLEVAGCSRDQVADKLVACDALSNLRAAPATQLTPESVRDAFDDQCALLSGGTIPLAWGTGRWRDLMSAKSIFHALVNEWTDVPDLNAGGRAKLTGRAAERAVAVDLLKNHRDSMPEDFKVLRAILARVTGSVLGRAPGAG